MSGWGGLVRRMDGTVHSRGHGTRVEVWGGTTRKTESRKRVTTRGGWEMEDVEEEFEVRSPLSVRNTLREEL